MKIGELKSAELVAAIEIYLRAAYEAGGVPENRRQFVGLAPDQPLEDLLTLSGVEALSEHPSFPGEPSGYALRIGNSWYPHMKLTIKRYKHSPGYVFGVDTHDAFRLPPNSPELAEVERLRQRNEDLARQVEARWEEGGLITARSALRQYLESSGKRGASPGAEQPPEPPPSG